MSEKRGYFENGKWIEVTEEATSESEASTQDLDAIVDETSQSVKKAMDDVVRLGKHLFGTQEGRERIEKKARETGEELERTIREAAESAHETLKKHKKEH